jgi:oxygen-independent coproporphyrinogen-3 oxidase
LRLNRGASLAELTARYGEATALYDESIAELMADGLLQRSGDFIRLTQRGRLLSNEVFESFISVPSVISRELIEHGKPPA